MYIFYLQRKQFLSSCNIGKSRIDHEGEQWNLESCRKTQVVEK